jgi:hypothetical protein
MLFGLLLPMQKLRQVALGLVLCGIAVIAAGQTFPIPLDPTSGVTVAPIARHAGLPEEYIWTAGDVTALRPDHGKFPWNRPELRIAPHRFRATFHIAELTAEATLYVAGPREAHIFLNGHRIDDFYLNTDAPIGFHVFHAAVAKALRVGENVLAIEAVRGRGIVCGDSSVTAQQLTYGEVLAVKIVPTRFGVEAPALVVSNSAWRSTTGSKDEAETHWADPGFDDSKWQTAESLGPIESNVDFFQWSADAGMYGWPGYRGMSPGLRTYLLPAAAATHAFAGRGSFANLTSLTSSDATGPFTVTNETRPQTTDADAPSLLLDFGREVAGRLLVESASAEDATLSIAYGESEIEAMATGLTSEQQGGNYLGTNILEVPANGVARGPKSGFRYVRIRFLRGAPMTAFKSIRVEGIYDPVTFAGSFESSDPLLNRIWETGAYTAHLCMQDGVWDAVKRDRGRWAGDLDVEGRVIATAFGDSKLTEDTLRALVPAEGGQVNGIPGYSAMWITSLYGVYSRSGDTDFVASEHGALEQILAAMDKSLNADGLFDNAKHQWLFVDWAPGLYAYTHEAVVGTNLEYVIAYSRASALFHMLGDAPNADKYAARSQALQTAIISHFRDADAPTFGITWQLNALATLAFRSDPDAEPVLWSRVFSHVKQDSPTDQVISPYFNAYVLDAMARLGHRREALDWMRTYWGGMLAEGATSFWESYDLRWPKTNPHLSLQADGTSGYFVSMAHGWSSGPTAWLTENVLGIRLPSDGYKTVWITPDLSGLDWAQGTVPTLHGILSIRVDKDKGITLDLPQGVEQAFVVLPFDGQGRPIYLDGTLVAREPNSTSYSIELTKPGRHLIGPR